jgi:ankyrin repeat protein
MTESDEFFQAITIGTPGRVAQLLGERPGLAKAADQLGKTGLHYAAEVNQVDAARALLEAGADLEARTTWGATPLDWAATMGSVAVGELLLQRGASGYTLVTAAALGHLDQVQRIVESGADPAVLRPLSVSDRPGTEWPDDSAAMVGDALSHALYSAARNGHRDVVAYLLERGANRDAKGFFGGTALHWAAINGHAGTVELLLENGADPSLKDARFDSTVEGWAEEGGHRDVLDLLRTHRR